MFDKHYTILRLALDCKKTKMYDRSITCCFVSETSNILFFQNAREIQLGILLNSKIDIRKRIAPALTKKAVSHQNYTIQILQAMSKSSHIEGRRALHGWRAMRFIAPLVIPPRCRHPRHPVTRQHTYNVF